MASTGAGGKVKKPPEVIEALLQTLGRTTVIQLQKQTTCPDTSTTAVAGSDETKEKEKEKEKPKGKVLIGTLAGFTDTTITLFNAAPYNPETEEIDVSTFADLSKPAPTSDDQHKSFIRHYTLDINSIKKFLNMPRRKSIEGVSRRSSAVLSSPTTAERGNDSTLVAQVSELNEKLKDEIYNSPLPGKSAVAKDGNLLPSRRSDPYIVKKKPTAETTSLSALQKQLQEEIESAAQFWIRMQTAKFIVRYSEPTTEAELKLQAEVKKARSKKAQEQKKMKKKEASDIVPEKDQRDTNITLYLEDIDAKKLLIRDELNVLDENRSKRARRVVLWATTPLSDIKNNYNSQGSTNYRSYSERETRSPFSNNAGSPNTQMPAGITSDIEKSHAAIINPLNKALVTDDFVAPEPAGGDDDSYLMGPSIDDRVYLGTAEGGTAPLHKFLQKQLHEAKQNPFALAIPAAIGSEADELPPLVATLQHRIDTLTRKEARASVGEALMWLSSQDRPRKISFVSHAVNVRTRLMKRLYVGNLFLALLLFALGVIICGAGLLAIFGVHSSFVVGYAMIMWIFAIPAGLLCVVYAIAGACTSDPWTNASARPRLIGFEVLVHIFLLVLLILSILPVADKGLGRHGVTSPKEYFIKEAALVGSEQKTRLCDWMTRYPRCTGYEEPCITNAFVGFDFVGLQKRDNLPVVRETDVDSSSQLTVTDLTTRQEELTLSPTSEPTPAPPIERPINSEYAYGQVRLDFKVHEWIRWARFYNEPYNESTGWNESFLTSFRADMALNAGLQPDTVLLDSLGIRVDRLQVHARVVLWKDGFPEGVDPMGRLRHVAALGKNGILRQHPELAKIIFPDQGEKVYVTFWNSQDLDLPDPPTVQPPNITSGGDDGNTTDSTGAVIPPINTEYAYAHLDLEFKLHDWIGWSRFLTSTSTTRDGTSTTTNGWDETMTTSLKSDIALNCNISQDNVLLDDLSIRVGRLQVFARIVLWKDGFIGDPNGKAARIRSLGKNGILAQHPELSKIIFPDQGERVVVTFYTIEQRELATPPPAPTPNMTSPEGNFIDLAGNVVPNINAETAFVVYSFFFKLHERVPWAQFARGNIWETDFVSALKTDLASNLNVTNQSIIIDNLVVTVGRLSVNARVVLWTDDYTGSEVDALRPSILKAGDDGNILLAQPTALNQMVNQSAGQSILVTFSQVEEQALASTKPIPAGCLQDQSHYASVCNIDVFWISNYVGASDPPQTCGAPFEKQVENHAAVFIALAIVTMVVLIVRRVYSECMTHRADSVTMTDAADAESDAAAEVARNESRVVENNDATDEFDDEQEEQHEGSDDDGNNNETAEPADARISTTASASARSSASAFTEGSGVPNPEPLRAHFTTDISSRAHDF